MFKIDIERDQALVRVNVWGFWSVDTARQFLAEEQAAVQSLGVRPGTHRLLVDVRGMKIQSQEVVELLRRMTDTADLRAERFAFIVAPGLIRSQVKRAVASRDIRIFDNEAEAMAYLTMAAGARPGAGAADPALTNPFPSAA